MSLYEVQRLLRQIHTTPDLRHRFREESASIMKDYNLSEEERAALSTGDLAALWEFGCHPLLLLQYARAFEITRDRYFALLESTSGKRELRSARGVSR